mmetsp:Transcript_37483/g.105846  ORF Transcript_37483/g.105846 Transcript_37483/m.105846 type:complete len:107 (-) Transcript_37483:290-610(-)|eukprot:CAMPEP_0117674640 /NCGR_PEP_ID=MMETSP0804-20121206/15150_1 /TAXON_ID=1074897 /ORGANISM="Tetraselmis astigmatica, Strain CCMP880" /LENGTH=106 /DNA_ID=CAMNT_0005483531 /DNA_START=237 /DNA_END=557 /DNA_ORIENTATION=-
MGLDRMTIGYSLMGIAAACGGYIVFSELSTTGSEEQQQVFRFLASFWPIFVLLCIKRLLWDRRPGAATAALAASTPKPPPGGSGDEDDDDDEVKGATARRRVRREK